MLYQENQIAQHEYVAFEASFYRPAVEGMTVRVPNVIDRAYAALRSALSKPGTGTKAGRATTKLARSGMPAR
jgi:hypothetical protein